MCLHDSFVGGKTWIFFQPRDLRYWISFNLTLQWGYTSFVYHDGRRRWHNRRSWDGFTRIALRPLRALIASRSGRPVISLRSTWSLWSLWSLRPDWSMFAGGTRPSSSPPDTLRALRHAGQVNHRQFNLPFNVISTDDFADVCFIVYFRVAFVTNSYFCNWETIYVTFMIVQWKNVLVDLNAPSILQTKLCRCTRAALLILAKDKLYLLYCMPYIFMH